MRKAIALALVMCLLSAAPAWAAVSILNALANGQNNFQDVSADKLVNVAGGATTVDVGDILLSAFAFNTIQNATFATPAAIGTGSSTYGEFSGLVAIKVLSKAPIGPGFSWTFGPATAAADVAAITAVSANAGAQVGTWGAGTMAAFFDDTTPDFSRNGLSVNADVATAVDGVKLWEFGFTNGGALDANGRPTAQNSEGWAAIQFAGDDISVLGAIGYPTNGGVVNFAGNQTAITPFSGLLLSGTGSGFPPFGLVDINGSANLLGRGGQSTTWDVFDNANITLNVVPEPTSLVLVLCGVLAVGVFLRRHLRRS